MDTPITTTIRIDWLPMWSDPEYEEKPSPKFFQVSFSHTDKANLTKDAVDKIIEKLADIHALSLGKSVSRILDYSISTEIKDSSIINQDRQQDE